MRFNAARSVIPLDWLSEIFFPEREKKFEI